MNPLALYIDTKTAIHCKTQKEADTIGSLIGALGGRNFCDKWCFYGDETLFGLEDVSRARNMYGDTTGPGFRGYKIILALEILNIIYSSHNIFN